MAKLRKVPFFFLAYTASQSFREFTRTLKGFRAFWQRKKKKENKKRSFICGKKPQIPVVTG